MVGCSISGCFCRKWGFWQQIAIPRPKSPVPPVVQDFVFKSCETKSKSKRLSRVLRHLSIDDHSHILSRSNIPDLHHPVSLARQLSPPARLLRILFDRLILSPAHLDAHRPKLPRPSPRHPRSLPLQDDLRPSHHLLRHRNQKRMIQHVPAFSELLSSRARFRLVLRQLGFPKPIPPKHSTNSSPPARTPAAH